MNKELETKELVLLHDTAEKLIKDFHIVDPIMKVNFHIAVCRAFTVCLNRDNLLSEVAS